MNENSNNNLLDFPVTTARFTGEIPVEVFDQGAGGRRQAEDFWHSIKVGWGWSAEDDPRLRLLGPRLWGGVVHHC